MKMFAVSYRNVCLCLFLQLVTGKSLDLQYGYQEIEDVFSQNNQDEIKSLDFDRISDDAIEEICKHFKVTIRVKEPESVINCLEPLFDGSKSVILMKREAGELEGSGDTDVTSTTAEQQTEETHTEQNKTENSSETNQVVPEVKVSVPQETKVEIPQETKVEIPQETKVEIPQETKVEIPQETKVEIPQETKVEIPQETKVEIPQGTKVEIPQETKVEIPPEDSKPIEQPLPSSEKPETPTDNPGSFQGGFDHILKNNQRQQNNSSNDIDDDIILQAPASNSQTKVKPDGSSAAGEEAKTGESQEKPTAASPNNMLLIVIGALGIIGALAFVYNFVKSKRESREIDEVMRLESEGKELKEMKPLMKSPLAQNGAKSMEYIDADPQIQIPTETRVEVTRDHNSE